MFVVDFAKREKKKDLHHCKEPPSLNMVRHEHVKLESETNLFPIDEVIRRHPYYTTVRLITTPLANFTPKPFLHEVSTTTNLIELIQLRMNASQSYIEAIPLDQVDVEAAFQNKLQFYGSKNEVILHIDQASYQKLPNLQKDQTHDRYGSVSSFEHAQVKRLTDYKIGHGENNYSRYRYKIKIKFSQPELEYIIKTLFNNVRTESYIYDPEMDLPIPECEEDIVRMPLSPAHQTELDDHKTQARELTTLFANLEPHQITNYQQYNTFPLPRYTMHNVYCESITQSDWVMLSLHTRDTHTFIEKDGLVAKVREEK